MLLWLLFMFHLANVLKVIPLFFTVHSLLRITLPHPRWRRFVPPAKSKSKKKLNPSSLELNRTGGATKKSKIKIHNSKVSSNFDLSHSLVFNVLFSSLIFCVGNIKPKTCLISSAYFEHGGRYFVSRPSPRRPNYPSWLPISKPCPPITAVCEETSTVTPDFFPAGLFRGWRVAGGGWRVTGDGWRVAGGG